MPAILPEQRPASRFAHMIARHQEHQLDVDERGPAWAHAMESRRQRIINNVSWATTLPVLVPPPQTLKSYLSFVLHVLVVFVDHFLAILMIWFSPVVIFGWFPSILIGFYHCL